MFETMAEQHASDVEAVLAALARVRAALEDVFGHLEQVASALLAARTLCRRSGDELTSERLARLRCLIQDQLCALPAAAGAGVVAAPGVVAGRERHLEWWQRGAGGGYARLRLNPDQASVDLTDYLDMEWFRVPRDERRRCVYGPYIDFSCADRYVLTMTMPVVEPSGEFLGVVGADIAMSHFEPGLLRILRSVPAPAVLVTAERRVIAANTPRWIAGCRLAGLPRAGDGTFDAVAEVGADSGWLLAVAPPPSATLA